MTFPATARRNLSFGGRVPPVIGALIALTLLVSILSAPGLRVGAPIAAWGLLVPGEVLRGQAWRLLSWVFFATSPFGLLFSCLGLYWFGKDLYYEWGLRRFLLIYFGTAAATGVVATLVATLVAPDESHFMMMAGASPVVLEAFIIYWALSFPDRTINFYFVFPLRGMTLVWVSLGATALFAVYYGFFSMLPEMAAEAVSLLYMFRFRLLAPLRRAFRKKPTRKPPTSFQVWDEKKQQFRPPKWMN